MSSETTLILFKPDAVSKNITGQVLSRFQAQGFKIRGIKMMHLSDEILAEHYSHIADKPFFPSVRGFMQETPVIALALEGENVIAAVRDLLGPTDSMAAAAGTIRGDFGQRMRMPRCATSATPPTPSKPPRPNSSASSRTARFSLTKMLVERVKYVIWAADLARATHFYQKSFGAEVIRANNHISELDLAGATIGIHGGGEGKRTWTGSASRSRTWSPEPRKWWKTAADWSASRPKKMASLRIWRCVSTRMAMSSCSSASVRN